MLKYKLLLLIITAFIFTTSVNSIGASKAYQYDDLHRLTRVERSDGSKTVYTYDEVGNRTSKVVTVDTIPPTGSITINGGATYTNTTSVTLNLTCSGAGSGCAQMQFSNDNSSWSTAEAYATSKTWTLTSGDGTKTVSVKFKDNAGNWSDAYNDTIVLETPIPNISSSPASLNFGDVLVNTTTTAQEITVSNTGEADLHIGTATITGDYIKQVDTCSGNTVLPSSNCNVQIAFSPTAAGARAGTLSIPSDDPDTAILDIPLSGTGVEQAAQQPVFKEGLEVLVTCPNSVTAGSALTVTVNVNNWDCANSITVSRMMVQLMGNSGGTLSGLGMWGPYNKATSVRTFPAATCTSPETQTPGTTTAFMPTVINAVPASLSGKMAEVDVDVITSTGETLGSGSCMVNVQ